MELKMKYQYTYFMYPYIVKEEKFHKYLLRLLKDKKCHLHFWEKERETEMYSYFLPNVRNYLFPSFEFSKNKLKKWKEMEIDTKAALLTQQPCTVFEYDIPKETQGKIGEENGIFFRIEKVELICFQTGICFLSMKTHIENTENLDDALNFNYKFRELPSDVSNLKKFENIKIQTDSFENMEDLNEWITSIIGTKTQSNIYNVDTDRFLTYSYVCIDQEFWNESRDFKEIEHAFYKLQNGLPSNDNLSYNSKQLQLENTFDEWKYIRMGFSKTGVCLFSSDKDTYNYTKLPYLFETQYFYTYILKLYQRIYLNKLNIDFQKENTEEVRRKFIDFTQEIYIQDITSDDIGNHIAEEIEKSLEIEAFYHRLKKKYDIIYKEMNIEKDKKVNRYILLILLVSLLLNVINFILLFQK